VQEYGVSNQELVESLRSRGAEVTSVPVYRWALPEDIAPLKHAVEELAASRVDVTLVTTATQLVHLLQVAGRLGHEAAVLAGLKRTIIASIGPTTSEQLRRYGLDPDLEPSHPKIGVLVREAAERARVLLAAKG
jgi:uroporphyrinogen-III synthase